MDIVYFIDGVRSMTEKIIDKIDNKNNSDSMRGKVC